MKLAGMTGLIVAAVAMALAQTGRCAEPGTAVVDMSRLIQALPKTQQAERELRQRADEFSAERERMLEKHKALNEDFLAARKEAMDKALSERAREEKRNQAEEKLMRLKESDDRVRDLSTQRRKELEDLRRRMFENITTDLRGIIEDYAKKNNLELVLDTADVSFNGVSVVVFSDRKMDVTDDILKIIGTTAKATGTAKAPVPAPDPAPKAAEKP